MATLNKDGLEPGQPVSFEDIQRLQRERRMKTKAPKPAKPAPVEDDGALKALREEYADKIGKRPFMGWGAETLKAKIAKAED